MKPIFRLALIVLLLAAFTLTACHGRRITKANVDQVTQGMTKKQVESILGPPTAIDSTDLLIMKKVTYTYREDKDVVTIVFTNDEVSSKESTLRK